MTATEARFGPYGIFWSVDSVNDFESTLPASIQLCSEARAAFEAKSELKAAIADEVSQMMRESENPEIQSYIAPETARFISYVFRPGVFDEKQEKTLKNIVSFGLNNYLTGDDLETLALHISFIEDSDTLLSSFLVLVSLNVAREMHLENIANGGITPHFESFIDWAQAAAFQGDILIRAADVDDYAESPAALAAYDPSTGEIVLPPIDDNTIVAFIAGSIIHECRHAYDRRYGDPLLPDLYVESPAYEISDKMNVLLDRKYGFDFDERSAIVNQLDMELEAAADEFGLARAECFGYYNWYYDYSEWKIAEETREAMRQAAIMELQGESSGQFQPAFEEWYRGNEALLFFGNLTTSAIDAIMSARTHVPDLDSKLMSEMKRDREAIAANRDRFLQAPLCTEERAKAALNYLDSLIAHKAIAGYLNDPSSHDFDAEFAQNFYAVGDGLLYGRY
jgi:hypothetical protein